jgi:hypothetical protein
MRRDPLLSAALARRELEMGERLLERAKGEGRAPAVADVADFEAPALGRFRPRNAAPWGLLAAALDQLARPLPQVPDVPCIDRTPRSVPLVINERALQRRRYKGRAKTPITERFWSHVRKGDHPDACWIWTGATAASPWGITPLIGFDRGARRGYGAKNARHVAVEMVRTRARREPSGRCPLTDLCVRVDHFVAPDLRRGEKAGRRSKISDAVRRAALHEIAAGEAISVVAKRAGVSRTLLYEAIAGRVWPHIPRTPEMDARFAQIVGRGLNVAAGKGRAA